MDVKTLKPCFYSSESVRGRPQTHDKRVAIGNVRGRNVDSSISLNHVLPIREADGINDELNPVHLYSNDHE